MKSTIDTPCGKMPTTLFRSEYEKMTDKEICDRINGRFVDPFALAEMESRPNIVLIDGLKAEEI